MNDTVQPDNAPKPPINKLAIVNLVSSIVLWLFVYYGQLLVKSFPNFIVIVVWLMIVTLATGHTARLLIKRSNGAEGGDTLAGLGLIFGYALIALAILFGVLGLLIMLLLIYVFPK